MGIQFTIYERMLLGLLKASLSTQPTHTFVFESADELAWSDCFDLAKKQGVMALAWDGIMTLPEKLRPPKQIKLAWALQVEDYEKKYERYVKTLVQLRDFYAEYGIALVLLKGVGLSSYYPNPSYREGGDLDIYTYSLDQSKMSDEEANRLADQLMMDQGIDVVQENPKHSVFVFQGVPVENHHFFLNEYNIPYGKAMDTYLRKVCEPRSVSLLDGKYLIPIPSPEFNAIFVPFHAMQHWGEGLCLHHLCDCAAILQKYGLGIINENIDQHYTKAVSVFAAFANQYLGTNVKVEFPEDLYDLMMAEVFRSRFDEDHVGKGWFSTFFFKCKRYTHRLFIWKKVIGISVIATIIFYISIFIKRPKDLFK